MSTKIHRIDRHVLESALHCTYKAYLKLCGQDGVKSDYELMLSDARNTVRLKATEKILNSRRQDEVVQKAKLVAPLLRKGIPFLLGTVLESSFESLCFDGLKRVEHTSTLGKFQYVPLLFHEAHTVGRLQRLLLELYGHSFARLQGTLPTRGIVWHGKECTSTTLRLFSDVQKAQRLLGQVKELRSSATPPKLVLNNHCHVCEFNQRCRDEATKEDNISLLRGLSEKEIRANEKKGIFTLTQFAHTFRARRKSRKKKKEAPAVQSQKRYHSLQAMAIRDNKVYLFGSEKLPNHPIHIYLDLEGVPDEGYVYLIGMLICIPKSNSRSASEARHSLWANSKEEESQIFEQFLDVVGRYDNCLVFAYGGYEKIFIKRMRKHAKKKGPVDRVLGILTNTLSLIYSHIYFPCHSNGLKDVGAYLGCSWTESDASGIQSIVWRRRWETTGDDTLKSKLITYNQEDCAALKKVTEFVYAINANVGSHTKPLTKSAKTAAQGIVRVEESVVGDDGRPNWGPKMDFFHADYEYVNDCGYFDYQRQRVYIRTSKAIKKMARRVGRQGDQHNRKLRVTKQVLIVRRKCPECRSTELVRDVKLDNKSAHPRVKRAFDLTITPSGMKRKVIEYRTSVHQCLQCGNVFVPERYKRLTKHLHGLRSWAIYMHVEHRVSFGILLLMCKDLFDINVSHRFLMKFKFQMARFYSSTHRHLWQKILSSPAIHIDETHVKLQKGKGYVWVFTTMEEVIYLYRPNREGDFLHSLLKDFHGVLISDFYPAYDSLKCPQQKCLVHLMRDINQALLSNPYDEVLQSITAPFGVLLRAIIKTVDEHGLKHRHLKRHERAVAEFFRKLSENCFPSDAAEELRTRLLRYRHKLFTFLKYDGVCWNNNNAEHAIKRFAYYRADRNGMVVESGLNDYLAMLSICESCRYKGVGFLKFLLSKETDIDVFCARKSRRRPSSLVEVYPKDYPYLGPHERA